jgi:hypothetical protein
MTRSLARAQGKSAWLVSGAAQSLGRQHLVSPHAHPRGRAPERKLARQHLEHRFGELQAK